MSKQPISEVGVLSEEVKKSFLLGLMRLLDNAKVDLKNEVAKRSALEVERKFREEMIEEVIDDTFSHLSKFLISKIRDQLDRVKRELPSTLTAQSEQTEQELRKIQNKLQSEQQALTEAKSKISEQLQELEKLRAISMDYDETQLWLSQALGEKNQADLKNQVRDLVKTIIESSKRLSRYKNRDEQLRHDLESYSRMFTIVDILSKEDSTVRALRILSDKEKMTIKELADATGQNSLVLKMKLRRFSRSGAIKLDEEGFVEFEKI